MYTLHEELARERMLDARRVAEQYQVSRQLASGRRWRRLEQIAHSGGHRATPVPPPIRRVDSASLGQLTLNSRPKRQPPRPAKSLISPEVFST